MKQIMLIVASVLALLGPVQAADAVPASMPTFWGKITTVDLPQKTVTVYNRKKKKDMSFIWDASTKMTDRKEVIAAQKLEAGQFLKVTYLQKDNKNWAQEIAVRPEPFKKSTAKSY